MEHIVYYSGGICSWATAMRVKERHPDEPIHLVFADTRMEDEDLYRFLDETEDQLGLGPIIYLADGRNPWQVFKDNRCIGNSRMDPCSKILKRELMWRWTKDNFDPSNTVLHFGIDWTEYHRLDRLREKEPKWNIQAYMTEKAYLTKRHMLNLLKSEGIRPPRLYDMGFAHNNCGGFCIKSGQAQFALLLKTMPERYAWHESNEEEMRSFLGKDYSIMKGKTMRQFREDIEAKTPYDEFDWGGCGCALE